MQFLKDCARGRRCNGNRWRALSFARRQTGRNQDRYHDIPVGTGGSVFGVPAKAAAEMIAEDLNKKGGIGGVPVKLSFHR